MTASTKIVIYGVELSDEQAAALREVLMDACRETGRHVDAQSLAFDDLCRGLYQLIKSPPVRPFDPPEEPAYMAGVDGRMTIGRGR